MEGGVIVIILLLVAGVAAFMIHYSQQVGEAWAKAADDLGIHYEPGGLFAQRRISGNVDGCGVSVETYTRGSGKHSRSYSRYRIGYRRSLRLGLRLRRKGFFGGVAEAFGAQDIRTGDGKFDSFVSVKGRDPELVARFLDENRRKRILAAMTEWNDLEIHDTHFQIDHSGAETTTVNLVGTVRQLVALEPTLVGPATAVAASKAAPSASPAAAAAGAASAGSGPPAREPAPESPQEPGREMDPEPEPESEPQKAQKPEPEPEPETEASEVGGALFGGDLGVAEIDRLFAADHASRPVRVRGILKSVRAADFDFTFGAGACGMATVEVPLEGGGGGRNKFEVIARLPEDSDPPAAGDAIELRGEMVKADGLMRHLYVKAESVRSVGIATGD